MESMRFAGIKRRGVYVAILPTILILAAVGCTQGDQPDQPEQPTHDRRAFGDAYRIVTNEFPALPDDPPALISDTLSVHVSYPGGCENHRFDFEYESEADTTRLWIFHRDEGDSCEEQVFERLEFPLPESTLQSGTIVLLNPNHDVPFVLRWGTTSPAATGAASRTDR